MGSYSTAGVVSVAFQADSQSTGVVTVLNNAFDGFALISNYLAPHDQGVAILASSITGTVLCTLGGILYAADAAKMKRIWLRLSTF